MGVDIIIPLVTKNYLDLPEKVRTMVAEKLDRDMQRAYNVKGIVREYVKMLEQVNPKVSFYVDGDIRTHRIIDTTDHKLAAILGKNLAAFAKFNPALMDRVLTRIINKE